MFTSLSEEENDYLIFFFAWAEDVDEEIKTMTTLEPRDPIRAYKVGYRDALRDVTATIKEGLEKRYE